MPRITALTEETFLADVDWLVAEVGDSEARKVAVETLRAAVSKIDITQTAHGFDVGDVVYFDGADYVLAQADDPITAEVAGIVSVDIGANDFSLQLGGFITGLTGLTAGETYFLSASVAGGLTATEPTTVGYVSKPLLIAASTTSGYFFNFRGLVNSGISEDFLAARVRHSTTQSLTDSTWTTLTFDTETRDDGGFHAGGAPTRLTIPEPGWYDVKGVVQFAANQTGARGVRLRLNGATVIAMTFMAQVPQASDVLQIPVVDHYYFAAGDYIELQAFQASTGSLNASGGEGTTVFSIAWAGQTVGTGGRGIAEGARVRRTTNQSISNNAEEAISFDEERYDTHSFHDNSTNPTRLTIPAGMGGKYSIGGSAYFESLTGFAGLGIRVNGATFIAYWATGVSNTTLMNVSAEYELAVGDYVELIAYQNSGSAKNIETHAAYSPEMWLSRISGGGGSNAFHGVRLYHSTTQSVSNNTDTKADFDTEEFDTDGYHTGGAPSRITIPSGMGGYYELIGHISFAANATGQRSTRFFKNGAGIIGDDVDDLGNASLPTTHYVSTIIYLEAGDYVEVNTYQTSGGALNIGNASSDWLRNSFSAHRIGV